MSENPVGEDLLEVPPSPGYVDATDENKVRGNWAGKLDFILSCLSYAVGLGNVWRFPYQCYKNGGGAFVLPFIIMLFVTGIPLFFLESAFGQYANSGVISIWKASPLFQGIGFAMFVVSFLVSIYYNVIIAWAFFYLFASFQSPLPWSTCNNEWNTPACYLRGSVDQGLANCTLHNGSYYNETCYQLDIKETFSLVDANTTRYTALQDSETATQANATRYTAPQYNQTAVNVTHRKSASDEYFHLYVLKLSSSLDNLGSLRWQLVLCLILSWVAVGVCMIKGIKSSGRAVYFTATFPYLVLLILLLRSITLPGSAAGIIYFLTPQWEKLLSAKVWCDAAVQIFFSLAPGWGGLITLASYNKFNNNCLRDTYIVCIGDVLTSVFAGMVIFAIIGYLASELGEEIDQVADEGAGLAFIMYPEVVTRLPASPLWAVLFFSMLITLGLGTQFAIVNTVHTTIIDAFPQFFHKGRRPSYLMMVLCIVGCTCGLTCCTEGGMYMLQLMDSYSATYSVLIIGLAECLVLSWVYGYDQLVADIKLMLGIHIGIYWKITWKFISPLFLFVVMVFTWIDFKPMTYKTYKFPGWSEAFGFCLTLLSVLFIPGIAMYKVYTGDPQMSVVQRVKHLAKPSEDWGPSLFRNRGKKEMQHHRFLLPQVKAPLNNEETTIEMHELKEKTQDNMPEQ